MTVPGLEYTDYRFWTATLIATAALVVSISLDPSGGSDAIAAILAMGAGMVFCYGVYTVLGNFFRPPDRATPGRSA